VYTKKKFVTSHYHLLRYVRTKKSNPTFNLNCRFESHQKAPDGTSLLYKDLEDVFIINRDYQSNQIKNQNKLPEELIRKLIQYSSHEGDMVCDLFMGNFTTAYAALKLGRKVCGYEINRAAYDHHMP
jgi:site-specific DNA-methyltransferase (adenine-specific)